MKKYCIIHFLAIILLFVSCSQVPTAINYEQEPPPPVPVKIGENIIVYERLSIPVPKLLKRHQDQFFINTNYSYGGILVFQSKVERHSLTNFFSVNMKKYGWIEENSNRGSQELAGENLLLFKQGKRYCMIRTYLNDQISQLYTRTDIWYANSKLIDYFKTLKTISNSLKKQKYIELFTQARQGFQVGKLLLTKNSEQLVLDENKSLSDGNPKDIDSANTLNTGRYFAILIGNNKYHHLPILKTAENDVKEMANVLKEFYGFNIELLLNGTRSEILGALDKIRKNLTPLDNLLIYYAGHGYFDREANRGYWLPVDAEESFTANWISNADITDKLKAYHANHVIVIADSCYSGSLTRSISVKRMGANYIRRLSKKKSRTVLTSGGLEPVVDSDGGTHSIFARAIINVLRQNDGILDGTELFTKIRRPVIINASQTPQYSDIRFAGHEGGDFIFLRKY